MSYLINTLETPGEFDALSTLRPEEPYFLLVGRDRLAPPIILQWADDRRRRAMAKHREGRINDIELDRDLTKATQAEMIAWAMQAYKRGLPARVAAYSAPKPSYSGTVVDAATHARDEEQRIRTKAVSVIHNAIAELVEANATLEPYNAYAAPLHVLDVLRSTATLVAPARPV